MEEQETQPEIYVGDKPLGAYVKAVRYRVNDIGEAKIVARGNNIRKAVDTAEIVKRESSEELENYDAADISISDINTLTERGENEDESTFIISKIIIDVEGNVEFSE